MTRQAAVSATQPTFWNQSLISRLMTAHVAVHAPRWRLKGVSR